MSHLTQVLTSIVVLFFAYTVYGFLREKKIVLFETVLLMFYV